jgi:hypothetical protein
LVLCLSSQQDGVAVNIADKSKKLGGITVKKIGSLLFIFVLFLVPAVCLADSATNVPSKPVVAILFVNNAKTTFDDDLTNKMLPGLRNYLGDKYDVRDGAPFVERLNKNGIADISTAERSDIVEVFKGEDIDYAMYVEVQPFLRKEKHSMFSYGLDMTAVVPFKIISLKANRYLYNGKFTEIASEGTMIGGLSNESVCLKALDIVNEKMDGVIDARLPLVKPDNTK